MPIADLSVATLSLVGLVIPFTQLTRFEARSAGTRLTRGCCGAGRKNSKRAIPPGTQCCADHPPGWTKFISVNIIKPVLQKKNRCYIKLFLCNSVNYYNTKQITIRIIGFFLFKNTKIIKIYSRKVK